MADVPSFCPKCGNTILPGHTFCFKCGMRRYEPAATAGPTPSSSESEASQPAREEIAASAEDVGTESPSPAPPPPSSSKPPSFVAGPPPDALVPRETAHCSNCGVVVDVRSETCWNCGREFEAGTVASTEVPSIPIAPSRPGPSIVAGPSRLSDAQRSRILLVCLVVGLALLLGSLVVGWYTIAADDTGYTGSSQFTLSGTASFYLLDRYVQTITCSGSGSCPPSSTTTGTYPGSSGNSIANLYGAVSGLVLAAVVTAALALVLAFFPRSRLARWGKVVVILALVLAAVAPLALLVGQPSALSSIYSTPAGGVSPGTSFFGSCSGSACGTAPGSGAVVSAAWGPSVGWFLCLFAVVPFLVGFFLGPRPPPPPSKMNDYVLPR